MCTNLRLLSTSLMKVLQYQAFMSIGMSQSCIRLAPASYKLRYIPSHNVSEDTSQTHHPEHVLETLGADDMWHAIMQIITVNMTYFPSHERQFLSHSPKRLRHFHCITSGGCVSKYPRSKADGMTTASLHRFGN